MSANEGFVGVREGATWEQVVAIVLREFPSGAYSILRRPDDITDPQPTPVQPSFQDKEWDEGQVFDKEREIRWRQRADGKFTLTCLTENRDLLPDGFHPTAESWQSVEPSKDAAFLLWDRNETRIPRTLDHRWGKSIVYREFRQQPSGVTRLLRLVEVRG